MAEHRSRKNKQSPNYNFLISYDPSKTSVKRETSSSKSLGSTKLNSLKKAEFMAKEDSDKRIRKDIIKSLILVSFILAVEVGIYLARSRFGTL